MSDVDPTPSTPVTIRDALGWFRGMVAAQFEVVAAAVAAIRGAGTDTASLFHVKQAIDTARLQIVLPLERLVTAEEFADEMSLMRVQVGSFHDRIEAIQRVLGAEPYGDTELGSIKNYLAAMQKCCAAQLYGRLPTVPVDGQSSEEVVSNDGRVYARFTTAPVGTRLEGGGITLVPEPSWDGYQFYIQTTDPAPWYGETPVVPNRWITMSGSAIAYWSVAGQYTITVYIKTPTLSPEQTFTAKPVTNNTNGTTDWYIDMSEVAAWYGAGSAIDRTNFYWWTGDVVWSEAIIYVGSLNGVGFTPEPYSGFQAVRGRNPGAAAAGDNFSNHPVTSWPDDLSADFSQWCFYGTGPFTVTLTRGGLPA